MAKPTDERFTLTDEFERSPATSSKRTVGQTSCDSSEVEVNRTPRQDSEQDDNADGLGDGMDADGFAGPKIVKPLTPEALAAFRAAQENAGVIYISRIPPGMQPTKVRHLMSQYGEVGRVYLQKEGMTVSIFDRTNLIR
jgi:ESF2/ABP1 family protein